MRRRNRAKLHHPGIPVILILLCVLLAGCSCSESAIEEDGFYIYYVNDEETRIYAEPYTLSSEETDTPDALEELLTRLSEEPDRPGYEVALAGDTRLLDYTVADRLLVMNFSREYLAVDSVREVLVRAAIVRTLTQIDGIDNVYFMIENEPLSDIRGNLVGNMSADTFIYNAGNEINAYERIQLTLYFADEDGDALIPVHRTVVYNSNISLERLVVDQLISGPQNDIAYPCINSLTGVLTVNARDGICYVDLDESFLNEPYAVQPEVAVYSIVNSLAELPGVNKVQLSVDGITNVDFMDSINFNNVFERNLDIVNR